MDRRLQLERLYADHASAVLAYARRRIDPATADDVLGDVFVVAWRRIDDVPAEPRTWLLGIARKTLANHRRSTDRQGALLERLAAEPGTADVDDPGVIESDLLLALSALKPADREVLLLVAWDQQTPRQAARILGIRPSAFSMRLKRARERLRAGLEQGTPAKRSRPARPLRESD